MDKYYAKGTKIYSYSKADGVVLETKDYGDGDLTELHVCSMLDGREFVGMVDCGLLTDYDGGISAVCIDGYISNLGLKHRGIMSGGFLVDKAMFLDICDKHNVKVNWVNK